MPEPEPGTPEPPAPRPDDVPDELVDDAVDAWHDAPRNEHGLIPLDDHMRHILATVVPTIRQAERSRTLEDLDAGRITPEDLGAASLDAGHVVDLRADGWTIQHPLTCGVDLFACPVNRAAERDLTGPPHEFGRFECGVENSKFWIGEAL